MITNVIGAKPRPRVFTIGVALKFKIAQDSIIAFDANYELPAIAPKALSSTTEVGY